MRFVSTPVKLMVASVSFLMLTGCSGSKAPADQKILAGLTPSTTTTGGITGLSSSSTALSATYAPLVIAPGGIETITPGGGTAPYVYKLVSGSGTLSGASYKVPALTATTTAPDVAVIVVVDSLGQTVNVTFNDAAALQQAVTMNPITYIQVPGGTPVKRNCDFEGIQKSGTDAGTVINYMFCQSLGRQASSAEISYYYNQVYNPDSSYSPYAVLNEIQSLPEFVNLYKINSMTPTNWVLLMYQMLTLTTPSASALASYVGQLPATSSSVSISLAGLIFVGGDKHSTVWYNMIMTQDYKTANPLVVGAQAQWQSVQDQLNN